MLHKSLQVTSLVLHIRSGARILALAITFMAILHVWCKHSLHMCVCDLHMWLLFRVSTGGEALFKKKNVY